MSSSDDDVDIPNGDASTPSPKAIKSRKTVTSHPKYNDMLIEALKALDEKKGASVIAIKHWIIQTYPEVNQTRMKNLLRMAIKRGVESGLIVRPKKSEGMGAALTGRFKLGKPPKPAKKAEKKKEKKKKVAAGKKKTAKSPTKKKDRKQSDHDVFDYEDDTEGSDPDVGKTPPPYKKNRAKKQPMEKPNSKKAVQSRPRSASANATPKPRLSKSRAIVRRSKSQSPAPSKLKSIRKLASKSPAKKSKSKSPAKKPKSKAATTKTSPAATGKAKAKKTVVKKKDKTPTKKAAKTTKKKINK
uniref:Cleavage stage histone H1 n=1 Tax=Psammechinus miliaris TaxID=7660 RepID=P91959_PSAMI|nr:cleavage stage histone H1 [Psammechinus miliaris]